MAVLLPFAAAGSAVEHGVRERTPLYWMKRPFVPLPLTALRKRKSERERVEGGGASQLDGHGSTLLKINLVQRLVKKNRSQTPR